jgi:hypothetical protein
LEGIGEGFVVQKVKPNIDLLIKRAMFSDVKVLSLEGNLIEIV